MCSELLYLLKYTLQDPEAVADKTGIRGLVVAKSSLDCYDIIKKFRNILREHPYEFRYALRIIPIERVVPTDIVRIKEVALELATNISKIETFRVTVEKRFTSLHSYEIIEALATEIDRKVNLKKPDKILLIEILGSLTGISLIGPDDIIAVTKEKIL
jgi:tRNA acetyltransferase TAN1